jgi:hypothetical protein
MIKLDPDDDDEEQDEDVKWNSKSVSTPTKQMSTISPNTSFELNDGVVNNVHLNNFQINLTKVALPPSLQNFVSKALLNYQLINFLIMHTFY